MRNKLLAIVAASALPLGLAASASAEDQTAQHEVTFRVAEERSISVAVAGSDDNVLDFGSIATTGTKTLPDAVQVTFSSPTNFDDIILMELFTNNGGSPGVSTNPSTGVIITATSSAITGLVNLAGRSGTLSSADRIIQGNFNESSGAFVNETFDVDFTLTTNQVATGAQSYFIRYTLTED
jgi:hypothetical protein